MRRPVILDGGMGRELERIGAPFRQPEWSALALIKTPELALKAHQAFIDSGADIITTNSYAVVPFHIGQEIFDAHGRDLIALSGILSAAIVLMCCSCPGPTCFTAQARCITR